jgi:hypothetical protein
LSSAKVTEYAESVGDEINMNRKHWWKETDKGKEKYDKKKACPNSTFSTANQKWIGLGSNPTCLHLHGKRCVKMLPPKCL